MLLDGWLVVFSTTSRASPPTTSVYSNIFPLTVAKLSTSQIIFCLILHKIEHFCRPPLPLLLCIFNMAMGVFTGLFDTSTRRSNRCYSFNSCLICKLFCCGTIPQPRNLTFLSVTGFVFKVLPLSTVPHSRRGVKSIKPWIPNRTPIFHQNRYRSTPLTSPDTKMLRCDVSISFFYF